MEPETPQSKRNPTMVAPPLSTAEDIMTTGVVSATVGTRVRDVALLLLQKRISAVPVLSSERKLVGIASEGDLLGRNDADRLARRDWWLAMLTEGRWTRAEDIEMLVARPVEQVMRAPVITIEARAPLHEVAEMLRIHDIKRLPVMRGDQMVGIVSRSDLIRAEASKVPPRPSSAAVGGLLSLFAGFMQTHVRPEDPLPSAPPSVPVAVVDPPPATANAFRALVTASKEAERDVAIEAKHRAKLDHRRHIDAMLLEHLANHAWTAMLERAHTAATLGEKSFELFRFPCDLCSDGSRKIDVAEADWPTTLRGEPAEIFARWERELRPAGFGLTAQIVDYFDGMPGNVALRLTWNPAD